MTNSGWCAIFMGADFYLRFHFCAPEATNPDSKLNTSKNSAQSHSNYYIWCLLVNWESNDISDNSKWYLNFIRFTRVETTYFNNHHHHQHTPKQTHIQQITTWAQVHRIRFILAVNCVCAVCVCLFVGVCVRTNFAKNFSQRW